MRKVTLALTLVAGLLGSLNAACGGDKTVAPRQAFLGLGVQALPPVLHSQLPGVFPVDQGVLVDQVVKDSPAARAGLQMNDILVTFGGQKLFSPEQFVKLVRTDKPGHEVVIDFVRGGKAMSCKATLGEAQGPMIPNRPRIFRLFPDERLRKMFEELESKIDASTWDSFDSIKLSRIDAKKWKAEVEYRSTDGKKISKTYTGSREEIRKAIQTEKELPANERTQLLRALNLHDPIFEFHFPPFGPLGPPSRHQP